MSWDKNSCITRKGDIYTLQNYWHEGLDNPSQVCYYIFRSQERSHSGLVRRFAKPLKE
jgi:hypothetical protein